MISPRCAVRPLQPNHERFGAAVQVGVVNGVIVVLRVPPVLKDSNFTPKPFDVAARYIAAARLRFMMQKYGMWHVHVPTSYKLKLQTEINIIKRDR